VHGRDCHCRQPSVLEQSKGFAPQGRTATACSSPTASIPPFRPRCTLAPFSSRMCQSHSRSGPTVCRRPLTTTCLKHCTGPLGQRIHTARSAALEKQITQGHCRFAHRWNALPACMYKLKPVAGPQCTNPGVAFGIHSVDTAACAWSTGQGGTTCWMAFGSLLVVVMD
jgi:hypothetical protein